MLKRHPVSEAIRSQRESMSKKEKRDRFVITLIALSALVVACIVTLKLDRYFNS